MNKRFRLKKSADFQRVRRFGKAIAHPFVVLLYLPTENEDIRFGIAAGKSVGNAVARNRAKRILRAAIQVHLPHIRPGHDCVLIARHSIHQANSSDLDQILAKLLTRADLLNKQQ
ncbi:MAG TPA: ribonuclease P protein component [Anaerolineales bacterium]|nr:ribonuclease P protein component [Anaerolineales bacterium]